MMLAMQMTRRACLMTRLAKPLSANIVFSHRLHQRSVGSRFWFFEDSNKLGRNEDKVLLRSLASHAPLIGSAREYHATRENQERRRVPKASSKVKSTHGEEEDGKPVPEKMSSWSKMREMMIKHGPIFTVYWGTAYTLSAFGVYYLLRTQGTEFGFDLARMMYLDRLVDLNGIDPRVGNLGLTILINEALEVFRFPLIVATTPKLTALWERGMIALGRDPERSRKGLSELVKEHGVFFFGYWTCLWIASGFGVFAGLEFYGPETALNLLHWMQLDQVLPLDMLDPKIGNIALAVTLNECLEPIRLPFTIATMSRVRRALGRA